MEINFYWHGVAMPDVQRDCIRTWADKGFKPILWSYNGAKLDCAKSKDAREIVELAPKEHPALFADGFRYKLLSERGGAWADADIVCLKSDFSFTETTFASELTQDGLTWQTNCFMFAKPGCLVFKRIYEEFLAVPRPWGWGMTGPVLVSRAIKNQPVNTLDYKLFCPLNWWDYKKVQSKSFSLDLSGSLGLHLWNELWRRGGGFPNLDQKSFLSQLLNTNRQ